MKRSSKPSRLKELNFTQEQQWVLMRRLIFLNQRSISIKTWSPKADIPVRLKLEAAGGVFVELDTNTTLENQWETLTWDFSGQTAGINFTTVVVFFEFVPDLPGDGSTYYYDDIEVAQASINK